ncbi:restriction endonuclease subunit S [Lactobacillus amylovorus]|nr:restriction endonuclease subunit S [Lactobacillus amylovorus]MDB6256764.1 restriction endonuclease subunit S [Lactobacillus amylovorus]
MKTNTLDFDAQALRERILDLAMRGKLVPQDPNDEPASVLLEKIKAEKEELVKEKKIKKTKALPEVTDDEKPFDIPDSWEWVRLGDVVNIKGGKRVPKGKSLVDYKAVKPYIRVTDMKENTVSTDNLKYATQDIYDQIKNYTISSKDIYFSIAGTIGKVGKIPDEISGALLTENAAKLTPYDINRIFLIQALSSNIVEKQHEKILSQVAQPKLSLIKLRQTIIPLPPLSEQSRIAAKIAQLFALLRKVESSTQQYAELQTLLKSKVLDLAMHGKLVKQDPNDEPASVLLEKIKTEKAELVKEKKIKKSKPLPPITDEEKPFDIPDSWEWVRLGDVINLVSGRDIAKKAHLSHPQSKSIPYITGASNINEQGQITITEWVNNPSVIVNKGTLLLSVKGTIGKIAVLSIPRAHIARQIMGIENIYGLDSNYQKFYLKSYVQELQKKAKSMIPGISRDDLLLATFPLPPITEQSRIVSKIKRVFELIDGVKHDYRFTSFQPNTIGPAVTSIKIDKNRFERYYNLVSRLLPLANLYKSFNMVKRQQAKLIAIIDRIHSGEITVNEALDTAGEYSTLYIIMHMTFIHNAESFINYYLSEAKFNKETTHALNIRAIRNYAEHCAIPVTRISYKHQAGRGKEIIELPIWVEKKNLLFFNYLRDRNKSIINNWEDGKIRLDIEIAYAWEELKDYFDTIKKKYIQKYVGEDIIKQILNDKELFEEKLLSEDVTGVIDLKRAGDGWPGEYFNSPKVLKNLINTIFILYK